MQILFDFIQLRKSIVDRVVARLFSWFTHLPCLFINPEHPFVAGHRIDNCYRIVVQKDCQLFTKPLKASCLDFNNPVFIVNIRKITLKRNFMVVFFRLKKFFQYTMYCLFRKCSNPFIMPICREYCFLRLLEAFLLYVLYLLYLLLFHLQSFFLRHNLL